MTEVDAGLNDSNGFGLHLDEGGLVWSGVESVDAYMVDSNLIGVIPVGSGAVKVEHEPQFAIQIFGDQLDLIRTFTNSLVRYGETLGLIGPLEPTRIWTRHIINCGLLSPLLRPGRVADVGSGAGLPGLVLAVARPDVSVTLIESMERRVQWLEWQVRELELSNVQVFRARAEDCGLSDFDQVTARAVSALRTLIPITVPLLRVGGEVLLMKGASLEREMVAAVKVMKRFKLVDCQTVILGTGGDAEATRVFRAIRSY